MSEGRTASGGACPADLPFDAALDDGTPICVRPVHSDDKPFLEDGLRRLSERSRQFRFLWPKRSFTPEELRAFTEVDQRDHVAVVAVDLSVATGVPVGIARFIRLTQQTETAEVAVAILDSHQGRGLGRILFCDLAARAGERGLQRLLGLVHSENLPMQRLFSEAGGHVAARDGEILEMHLPLRRAA